MNGLVIKKNSDKFSVLVGEKVQIFSARNLKDVGIFVGDKVEVDKSAINKVKERKNLLIRPPLANVDKMIIVISKTPKPDFLLVDKLIIFCVVHAITPVLCVNKSDLGEDFVNFVKDNYHLYYIRTLIQNRMFDLNKTINLKLYHCQVLIHHFLTFRQRYDH